MEKKKNRRTAPAKDTFLETLGPSQFASEVKLQILGREHREDEPIEEMRIQLRVWRHVGTK
jgi:hypothetical protein